MRDGSLEIMLAGPIGHWWSCWDSPEHRVYVAWRQQVQDALVAAGHLVYRPDMAWKGSWRPSAQRVNDAALIGCDVIVDLTPPGVASVGTEDELRTAAAAGRPVVPAPPGTDIEELLERVLVQDAVEPDEQQQVTVPVEVAQAIIDGLEDDPTPERVRHLALELRTLIRDERVVPEARPERWLSGAGDVPLA